MSFRMAEPCYIAELGDQNDDKQPDGLSTTGVFVMVVVSGDICSRGVNSYPKGEFEWIGNVLTGPVAREARLRLT